MVPAYSTEVHTNAEPNVTWITRLPPDRGSSHTTAAARESCFSRRKTRSRQRCGYDNRHRCCERSSVSIFQRQHCHLCGLERRLVDMGPDLTCRPKQPVRHI